MRTRILGILGLAGVLLASPVAGARAPPRRGRAGASTPPPSVLREVRAVLGLETLPCADPTVATVASMDDLLTVPPTAAQP